MAKFFKWVLYGQDLDHTTKSLGYGYICAFREQGAAATAAVRFKEAVALLKHVLHWSMDEELTSSRRIGGVAHQSFRHHLGAVLEVLPIPLSGGICGAFPG